MGLLLQFTTNGPESLNVTIKRKVDYKESDWPQFNEQMKQLFNCQREEVTRALAGRGQYRLKPESCITLYQPKSG